MKKNKLYWKGLEQLRNDESFVKNNQSEFPEYLPISDKSGNGPSRRDFLKMMGFGVAAVSLAACEAPVKYAIPYLNKPVDVDPTIPNYYASTYAEGGDFCSIVVKTREGRPIKIEGNKYSDITKGGTSAQVEASILSLYDGERIRQPLKKGGEALDWPTLDQAVQSGLRSAQNVRIISNTILSPSTKKVINQFASAVGGEHIMYDSASSHALIEANKSNFGQAAVPSYDFSKAEVIVSFGADFLGTWLSPVEFNKQYSQTRKLGKDKNTMSQHFQFESVMTVTGANADYRGPLRPSQVGPAVAALNSMLGGGGNAQSLNIPHLQAAAKALQGARGKGLVVSDSNDPAVQRLINNINQRLGNYGTTIDINRPAYYRQGDDTKMAQFVQDAQAGRVGAVVFLDCNPVYDSAWTEKLQSALADNKIKFKVSTAQSLDETAVLCDYVAPDNHYLESWNDHEPKRGMFSLSQPTIRPVFNTRQAQESMLKWSGASDTSYYNFLQNEWKGKQQGGDFQQFWDTALYTGVFVPGQTIDRVQPMPVGSANLGRENSDLQGSGVNTGIAPMDSVSRGSVANNVDRATADLSRTKTDNLYGRPQDSTAYIAPNTTDAQIGSGFQADPDGDAREIASTYKTNPDDLEIVFYQKTAIGTGRQANNPWLQEMPDPITKATWDNYITIPLSLAQSEGWDLKMDEGRTKVAKLTIGDAVVLAPVMVQPGQAAGTIGLALGYGRIAAGKVANERGVNAYPLLPTNKQGIVQYSVSSGVSLELVGDTYFIAQTQTHNTYMGRETVIQDATLAEWINDPKAGRFEPKIATAEGPVDPQELSLWDGHTYPNHHWAMVVDMNSCTGCGACTIACQVENNVPVVGKDEVLNRREMHWMRIDRYYSSGPVNGDASVFTQYDEMEVAAQNPEVTFQPMMCQHCNNAPCETVCPVVATTHSSEGLNQMTYNRCIGTRYCANNCPYKVRRFNWFKYHDNEQFAGVNTPMNDDYTKMVLNPDVTVRARGVMEKCSMCVQRIQSGKLQAKRERRRPVDGEIVTACASSCPADAITFGDLRDPDSEISQLLDMTEEGKVQNPRAYNVLREIGVRPNVFYLTKIRNKEQAETAPEVEA
jgi:molybdopterin-containing oxidoreductase family iron-sulfur binding subunit